MAGQGCPNEGDDQRIMGWLICPLQRWLSFSTTYEPLSIMVAFPPYLAINIPIPFSKVSPSPPESWGLRRVLHLRIGWRYDVNAHTYIFPEAAIKTTDRAVFY